MKIKLIGLTFVEKVTVPASENSTEYTYKLFQAPDGSRGSKTKFYRDAERGNLHGLTATCR